MILGIFDSGIGGEAVASSLARDFPEAEIITINDRDNVPYGNKPPEQIINLTETAIQSLLAASCDIIVLACNTATAIAIEFLRAKYPAQNFIGLEPMVKPAAELTNSGAVAICATPATLSSERYTNLKNKYANGIKILEPDCSKWAYMIEYDQINREVIKKTIDSVCDDGADIIVLGCTHYHWIKKLIAELSDSRARVIDPSEAISRRVQQLVNIDISPTYK